MRQKEATIQAASSKRDAHFTPVLINSGQQKGTISITAESDQQPSDSRSKNCQMPPIGTRVGNTNTGNAGSKVTKQPSHQTITTIGGGAVSAIQQAASPKKLTQPPTLQGTEPQHFDAFVKQIEDATVAASKIKKENQFANQLAVGKQESQNSPRLRQKQGRYQQTQQNFNTTAFQLTTTSAFAPKTQRQSKQNRVSNPRDIQKGILTMPNSRRDTTDSQSALHKDDAILNQSDSQVPIESDQIAINDEYYRLKQEERTGRHSLRSKPKDVKNNSEILACGSGAHVINLNALDVEVEQKELNQQNEAEDVRNRQRSRNAQQSKNLKDYGAEGRHEQFIKSMNQKKAAAKYDSQAQHDVQRTSFHLPSPSVSITGSRMESSHRYQTNFGQPAILGGDTSIQSTYAKRPSQPQSSMLKQQNKDLRTSPMVFGKTASSFKKDQKSALLAAQIEEEKRSQAHFVQQRKTKPQSNLNQTQIIDNNVKRRKNSRGTDPDHQSHQQLKLQQLKMTSGARGAPPAFNKPMQQIGSTTPKTLNRLSAQLPMARQPDQSSQRVSPQSRAVKGDLILLAGSPKTGAAAVTATSQVMMPMIVQEALVAQTNSQKSVSQGTACRKKISKKSISSPMSNHSQEYLSQQQHQNGSLSQQKRRGQTLQQQKHKANVLNRTMQKTLAGGQQQLNSGIEALDEVMSGRSRGDKSLLEMLQANESSYATNSRQQQFGIQQANNTHHGQGSNGAKNMSELDKVYNKYQAAGSVPKQKEKSGVKSISEMRQQNIKKDVLNKTADNFVVHKKVQKKKSTEMIRSSFAKAAMIKTGPHTFADDDQDTVAPTDQLIYENQYIPHNETMSDQNNDFMHELTFKNSIKQLKQAMRIKPDFKPINIGNRHRIAAQMNKSIQSPTNAKDFEINITTVDSSNAQPQSPMLADIATQIKHRKSKDKLNGRSSKPLTNNNNITTEQKRMNQTALGLMKTKAIGLNMNIQEFERLTAAVTSQQAAASLTSSRKLNQVTEQFNQVMQQNSSNNSMAGALKQYNHSYNKGPAAPKSDSPIVLKKITGKSALTDHHPQSFFVPATPNQQSQYKEGFAEIIKRQLMASQVVQGKQQAERQARAASLMFKKQQTKHTGVSNAQKSGATDKNPQKQKNKSGKVQDSTITTNQDLQDNKLGYQTSNRVKSPTEKNNLNKLSKNNKKEKQKLNVDAASPSNTIDSGVKSADEAQQELNRPNYPKYQIKEEQLLQGTTTAADVQDGQQRAASNTSPLKNLNSSRTTQLSQSNNQPANKFRAKSKDFSNHQNQQALQLQNNPTSPTSPQEVLNAQKYEQLMAQSFIPELSILERRIVELNKMPDQLRHYLERSKNQQQTGVTSILKPSDESSRLLLKQKDGKHGTKMLITARNDSLSRFTKELKQHQIPANKKVTLNLSPHGRVVGAGALTIPINSLSPGAGGGPGRDSTRKKVNFDLPQISSQTGVSYAVDQHSAGADGQ